MVHRLLTTGGRVRRIETYHTSELFTVRDRRHVLTLLPMDLY